MTACTVLLFKHFGEFIYRVAFFTEFFNTEFTVLKSASSH